MGRSTILVLIAAAAGAVAVLVPGPIAADIGVTRALQSLLGTGDGWARLLTDSAKAPLLWATSAVAAGLAWRSAGWRAALAVPVAYVLAFGTDKAIRAIIFAPRPDPALVAVAEPASSSGFPSTFGLVYAAMFGAVLLAQGPARRARPVQITAAAILAAGVTARIVMGGHWGSQMLASAALGLLLAGAALAITMRLPSAR